MVTIYKGDDTGAFGNNFLTIELEDEVGVEISKAQLVCGCYKSKIIENPQFPLTFNFDSEETKKLNFKNTCFLIVWDAEGRQTTCEGSVTFEAKNGVIQ